MKKTLNILYIVLAVAGGICFFVQLFFWVILPLGPVQRQLQKQLSVLAGEQISFSRMSAGFSHLSLADVRVASSCGGESAGDIFRAKTVLLRWSLWKLLQKHIRVLSFYIDSPELKLAVCPDGTLNSDSLFASSAASSAEQQKQETPAWKVSAAHVRISDGHVVYTQGDIRRVEAEKVFFESKDFSLDKAFPLHFNAHLNYIQKDMPVQEVEIGLAAEPELSGLSAEQMAVQISQAVLKHAGGVFALSGRVQNPSRPQAQLQLSVQDLNQTLLESIKPDAAPFYVDLLAADLAAEMDLSASAVRVSSFTVRALDSVLSSSSMVKLEPKLDVTINADFNLNLQTLGNALELLRPYNLSGTLSGSAQGKPELLTAYLHLEEVGAQVPGAGTLANLNTDITLKETSSLQMPALSGRLNGDEFTISLFAEQTPQVVNVDLRASAPRLRLTSQQISDSREQTSAAAQPQAASSPTGLGVPLNVSAELDIGALDAPFMRGKEIRFEAGLTDFTPALERTHGRLALQTGEGEIKDLNALLRANMLAKVLFGSLDVVSKVINSLDVISLLNGLGGVVSGLAQGGADEAHVKTVVDENGNEVQIPVASSGKKLDGSLAFEQFGTNVQFVDGLAHMERGAFVSDLISFNAAGDMNFKNRALDMTVNAAPGRHYEGGIMPLTIDVGGTLEEPQGSLRLASSVTSMLTQSVTNNFASRTLKKGVSAFVGLFKKKKPEPAANEGPVLNTAAGAEARAQRQTQEQNLQK